MEASDARPAFASNVLLRTACIALAADGTLRLGFYVTQRTGLAAMRLARHVRPFSEIDASKALRLPSCTHGMQVMTR